MKADKKNPLAPERSGTWGISW